ncbi:MAG: EamA/RhaT family transporter [Planctomycetota bacterium]
MHLLFPLLASLLLVGSLILINRASANGVGTFTVLFLVNVLSAAVFSVLWVIGGEIPAWTQFYQPLVIATLFMLGLMLTVLAVQKGDVSVATPVFGIKVLLVAMLLVLIERESLPNEIWLSAGLASIGIGLIQWTGRHHPRRLLLTLFLASSAATCFANFDVLVQRWAPAWGAGRFVPITYWMVGALSFLMWPWVDFGSLRIGNNRWLVPIGAFLMAMQALCIVGSIAAFGDAARINVVYALRGLWGVTMAWLVAKKFGGEEASLSRGTIATRFCGAVLLTTAVVLVILAE